MISREMLTLAETVKIALRKQQINYCPNKILLLVPALSQDNPVHIHLIYLT
jgi:hypothetical protein